MDAGKALTLIFVGAILLYVGVMGIQGLPSIPFQTRTSENYSNYTKVDPNKHIGVSPYHIDCSVTRGEDAYLYSDKGAGYFGTSFEHKLEIYIGLGHEYNAWNTVWTLANHLDDWKGLADNGKSALCVYVYRSSTYIISMRSIYNGVAEGADQSYICSVSTWYYLTIKRTGTTFELQIYSDKARTQLLATKAKMLNDNHPTHRYIYACQTFNDGRTAASDVIIENLEISGASPGAGSIFVMGYADQTAVQFSAYYVGPSGQGSTVTVPTSGYTWSNLVPGSYTVYGTYNNIQKDEQVTVVAGGTEPVTLTFSGTPPPDMPDFFQWIKDLLNDPMVKTFLAMGGVGCLGIGFIGLVAGRGRGQQQPYRGPFFF